MEKLKETMTETDLKKVRYDYRMNIFPSAMVTLVLILITLIYSGLNKNSGLSSILLIFITLIVGIVVFILITRKHRLDMKLRKISVERVVVAGKEYKLDYEAGSASLPVNVLSFIFINKIARREMKELHIYCIVVGGEKFYLDKINFDKTEIGGNILIRRTVNTRLFLGFETE